MKRILDNLWVWIGLIFGILSYLGVANPPSVSLEVLSIFFGGLLAIASILPATSSYRKIKDICVTGHINDLLNYIILPLWLSFILLLLEIINKSSLVSFPKQIPSWLPNGIVLAIWGVFLLSLIRLLLLLPYLLVDYYGSFVGKK